MSFIAFVKVFIIQHVSFKTQTLDATNKVIKDEGTLRDRLPLPQFFNVVEHDIVVPWSKARDPAAVNSKAWKSVPDIELKDWTAAYQWILERKET